MATRTEVIVEDDLGGGPGAETVPFSFEGTDYEIDLTTSHKQEFANTLLPYIEAGRKAGAPARRKRDRSAERDGADIRRWAAEQGIALSERGRIPASVKKQYAEAH